MAQERWYTLSVVCAFLVAAGMCFATWFAVAAFAAWLFCVLMEIRAAYRASLAPAVTPDTLRQLLGSPGDGACEAVFTSEGGIRP